MGTFEITRSEKEIAAKIAKVISCRLDSEDAIYIVHADNHG